MSELRKVVLIGGNGNVGSIVLRGLLDSPVQLDITVLTRKSSSHNFPPGVSVIKTDYSEAELVQAFKGQDVVISVVGGAAFGDQIGYVDAAVKAGVKRFIPSELSTNTLSPAVRELIPMFEIKQKVIDHLVSKEGEGLTWTTLFTGLLLDWGLRIGVLGFDLAGKKATIWDDGNKVFSVTTEADLGKAVVSILQNPQGTENKHIYVHTVATSQNAILKSLERQTGSTWAVEQKHTAEEVARVRQELSQGNFANVVGLVLASTLGNVPGTRANYATEEELGNKLLGIPEGDLDEVVKDVLSEKN